MSSLDDFIAPNLCAILLFVAIIIQSLLFLTVSLNPIVIGAALAVLAQATYLFFVCANYESRKRVYNVTIKQIRNHGYSAEIFSNKCQTLCMFGMSSYIVMRMGKFADLSKIIKFARNKRSAMVVSDYDIDALIRGINPEEITEGQVLVEYQKE